MNNIFVVNTESTTKNYVARSTLKEHDTLKAFRTKEQAWNYVEKLYYADIKRIEGYDQSDISYAYIENDVVCVSGSYIFVHGFTQHFLYKYKIETIPF